MIKLVENITNLSDFTFYLHFDVIVSRSAGYFLWLFWEDLEDWGCSDLWYCGGIPGSPDLKVIGSWESVLWNE